MVFLTPVAFRNEHVNGLPEYWPKFSQIKPSSNPVVTGTITITMTSCEAVRPWYMSSANATAVMFAGHRARISKIAQT